jgi:outer membrane protein OmpA-like peptidoglycan-associated protein
MKRAVGSLIVFSLAFFPIDIANATTTLSNTATSNPVFTEDGSELLIGEGITFTNETSFSGGYIEFAVGSAGATDILNLQKVSTAVTTAGVVSVVGSTIYRGDGTNANPVASIDGTLDGSAGKNLRIRFSSAFTNASFETGDFTGWEYIGSRIDIGVTTLAGVVSSDADNFYPNTCGGQSLNDNDAPQTASYSNQFATGTFPTTYTGSNAYTDGTKSLRLFNSMTTANGGDIVHGPAVVSNEFTAAANDVISFDWAAVAGSDDFDAYGYLINSATGAQIEVIDANGRGSNWATKSTTIPTTGNYRFVFINGTHDLSCGRAAGGSLYIDNIRVVGASATAALAQSIARLVTYKSTSNNPAATKTVTLSASPATGSISPLSITVDITAVDDGPVPSNISVSYTDTTANDDFAASTGTISANDPDGGSGGGSIVYGITGGTSASGTTTKVGTFGTLTVNEATGAYSYEPNDSAINTVVINTSETFTVTATSGALVGSATLTVSITGAAESSVSAPTISGISPNRGPISGGTVVTVTGSGFTTAQFVKFGDTFGTNLAIVSSTSLTIEAPAKLAGTYNLTVINTGGTNSGTNNYVYYIPSAPAAPTSVSATGGNQSATVSWTASEDATSYVVTSNPGSFTCTTSSTTCAVTGLTNGTPYTFTVIARNATGNSSASSASTAVTPALPLPSTPTSVTASAGNESAQVSWTASANSATYVVTSDPGGFTCTTASTTCSVTGLTNGTAYTFTVIGRNATGDSSASSASTSVTPAASVPSVTSVLPATGSTAGGTTVTITGVRFTGATSVTFGGTAGTSLTVVSDTSITVVTPAGTAGAVVIVVTTASGPDIDGVTFTYTAPAPSAPRRVEPTPEQIAAQNQALANRITISAPTNSNNTITGPVQINGISENSRIFVDPLQIPKLPGFSNIKVNQNSIEVIPTQKFSGNMTVPVTVSENGATVTLNISVVVNPKPVVEAQTSPTSNKSTGVVWEPSPNAVSYKVQLKGQPLCTSNGNSCTIPKLLGPNSKLEVISLGNDGTVSTQVIPAYVPSKPIPVLDVKFSLGSSAISKAEIRKLNEFVNLMKEQGFTKVSIDAFTDGVGGTKGAKTLAQARASQVAKFLDQYLTVAVTTSGKGISDIAKGSKKPLAAARKAQVSVS